MISKVDQCLPQTQCTLCSYPRCREYARAIVLGEADINQCPPGGDVTIKALAKLLNRAVKPLNQEHGVHQPKVMAWIKEHECIGCKLCIKACPVDCIVGAAKLMHTVISHECTGCKLCVPVCPTDCIDLIKPATKYKQQSPSPWAEFSSEQVMHARHSTEQRLQRITQFDQQRRDARHSVKRNLASEEVRRALKRKNMN